MNWKLLKLVSGYDAFFTLLNQEKSELSRFRSQGKTHITLKFRPADNHPHRTQQRNGIKTFMSPCYGSYQRQGSGAIAGQILIGITGCRHAIACILANSGDRRCWSRGEGACLGVRLRIIAVVWREGAIAGGIRSACGDFPFFVTVSNEIATIGNTPTIYQLVWDNQ